MQGLKRSTRAEKARDPIEIERSPSQEILLRSGFQLFVKRKLESIVLSAVKKWEDVVFGAAGLFIYNTGYSRSGS